MLSFYALAAKSGLEYRPDEHAAVSILQIPSGLFSLHALSRRAHRCRQIAPFSQHPAHPLRRKASTSYSHLRMWPPRRGSTGLAEGGHGGNLTIQRSFCRGPASLISRRSSPEQLNFCLIEGLPASAKLSRRPLLHIAQELDADFVVYGNFTLRRKRLHGERPA